MKAKRTYGKARRKRIKDFSKKMSRRRKGAPQKAFKRRLYRFTEFIKCCFCKVSLSYGEATIEHLIPKSKGGPDHWTNFGISCYDCNNLRGNMDYDEFLNFKIKTKVNTKRI